MKTCLLVGLTVWMTACDGDDGGGELSGAPCEQLAQRFCNEARDCADGGSECEWTYGQNDSTHGRNCSVCEGGLVDRFCNDSTKTAAMVDACAAAFDASTCATNDEGEPTVRIPDACDAMIACNDGPCTE